MYKQITAILFLFAFVTQTFSGGFVILNYYADTPAFTKNCENKSRPLMHCNGKCQVMKKLQESEKKEQQDGRHKLEIKITVLSSRSFFCSVAPPLTMLEKAEPYEINGPSQHTGKGIFHPPQA